ncbi:MAG: hypothetical protein LBI92_03035 [Azoarcus sp.]|jgi:hypothetical protein|nr:hypothetical protein [Azoarcus sp.]
MKYRSEKRVPYETLKSWALDAYFNDCRDHAVMEGMPHEKIMGYVSYTFEEGFERPVEDVMWSTILLVLSGGWNPDWYARARQFIIGALAEHGLEDLLTEVPTDEAETFRHDLRILKLIQ